jgi:hypothetical protein
LLAGKALAGIVEAGGLAAVDQHELRRAIGWRAIGDQQNPIALIATAELPRRLEKFEELADDVMLVRTGYHADHLCP